MGGLRGAGRACRPPRRQGAALNTGQNSFSTSADSTFRQSTPPIGATATIPLTFCILGERLEEVDATFCYQLGDRSVTHLVALPRLRVLKLGHCANVTRLSQEVLASRGIQVELTLEAEEGVVGAASGEGRSPTSTASLSGSPSS